MKGLINQYGEDKLAYVLLNVGGNTPRDVKRADERIATYGMQGFPRVRPDYDEARRLLPSAFAQFGYGYFVMDAAGRLTATGLLGKRLEKHLAELLGPEPLEADEANPASQLRLQAKVCDKQGGHEGRDVSYRLPTDLTCEIAIDLVLPEGYHVYGTSKANPTPTEVRVAYSAGMKLGTARLHNAEGDASGIQTVSDRALLRVPVTIPKGTPIGSYLAHGTVRFMACNDEGCLPPIELPWSVKIKAL